MLIGSYPRGYSGQDRGPPPSPTTASLPPDGVDGTLYAKATVESRPVIASIDFRTHLPVLREAIDARNLQCYGTPPDVGQWSPRYSGPCAIGAVIPEHARSLLDGPERESPPSVGELLLDGRLECPPGQNADWIVLQGAHDAAVFPYEPKREKLTREFEKFVQKLEKKYLEPESIK